MARSQKTDAAETTAPVQDQNTPQSTEDSQNATMAEAAEVPTEAPSEDGQPASEDGNAETSEDTLSVVCHAPDGRRRVGRRWPHGETVIAAAELTEIELQILRADPRFTVKG